MTHCDRDGQRPAANGHSPVASPTSNGHSNNNIVHLNGYSSDPAVVAILAHFAEVRNELENAESRDDKTETIQRLLESLPPALGQAARQHVLRQLQSGLSVNIDDLVNYLAKLEIASALATPQRSRSPSPPRHHLPPLKLSPSKRPKPPISAERESSDYIDFAPSRPHVSNLLLSDGNGAQADRPNGDVRTQEMR